MLDRPAIPKISETHVLVLHLNDLPLTFEIVQAEPEAPIPRIEAPIGSPLKNVVVHAGRPDPISLPDNEYPEWMWQLVRPESFPNLPEVSARKQLRKETKLKIKANNTLNN